MKLQIKIYKDEFGDTGNPRFNVCARAILKCYSNLITGQSSDSFLKDFYHYSKDLVVTEYQSTPARPSSGSEATCKVSMRFNLGRYGNNWANAITANNMPTDLFFSDLEGGRREDYKYLSEVFWKPGTLDAVIAHDDINVCLYYTHNNNNYYALLKLKTFYQNWYPESSDYGFSFKAELVTTGLVGETDRASYYGSRGYILLTDGSNEEFTIEVECETLKPNDLLSLYRAETNRRSIVEKGTSIDNIISDIENINDDISELDTRLSSVEADIGSSDLSSTFVAL
jgi:hypothetical protein